MPRTGFGGDFGGCFASQAGVRSHGVVVLLPGGEFDAGVTDRGEQRLVQAFVPEPPVEAFHEAVLHRLSRRDVVPVDAPLLAPSQDRHTGQFGAVAYPELSVRGVVIALFIGSER
jgi:hypothetical protein